MDYTNNNSNNNSSNSNIDSNIDSNNNNNYSTSPLLRRVRVPPSESRYKQCKCKCLMYPSDTYLVCASNNNNNNHQCQQQRMQRLRLECGNKIFNKNLIYFIYNYRKRKEAKESKPPRATPTDTDTYVSCVHCMYKRSTRYARTHKPRLSPVLFAQRDLAATLPGSCSCKLCKYL